MENKKTIAVAAPAYNEAKALPAFLDELEDILCSRVQTGDIVIDFTKYIIKVVIVNDGSTDDTLAVLCNYHGGLDLEIIDLARNFGHVSACMACIDLVDCDALILMDSDLQDDPKAIVQFIAAWEAGWDVVYAVRAARKETGLAKMGFVAYYRLLNMITNIKMPLDAGNFSLMDGKVLKHIKRIPQRNSYLPGIRAYMGFNQTGVSVPRRERHDKHSRVGLKGLFSLAFNGIFSFSYLPIRLFNILGILSLLAAILLSLYALWSKFIVEDSVVAWASQIISISFFGGINILGLGIIGEYVARIHDQLKGFPPYVVRNILKSNMKRLDCG
ncbi:MAG: glycosyltransferase family 2 protein [Deltaproteobacteria bacterium]|jgi:dolichol-phosphate mannosyltransferase|nr:glycosyltransferase family 2 protein [Deltaproteobacteria bacterium]